MGRVWGGDRQLWNSGQYIKWFPEDTAAETPRECENSPRVKKVVGGLSPDTFPAIGCLETPIRS